MKRSNTQIVATPAKKRGRESRRSKVRAVCRRGTEIVTFPSLGFPPKLRTKLRYAKQLGLAGGLGAVLAYNIRCNGLYDPDASSTGHQPLYFDQLTALYNHFTVFKSYLKLTIYPVSSDAQTVTVFENDDTSITPVSQESRMEQSSAKSVVVTPGMEPVILNMYFDAQKTFGGSLLGNDDLQGSAVADPLEQAIWTISAQANDLAKNTVVGINIEVIYDAVWDELKDINGS